MELRWSAAPCAGGSSWGSTLSIGGRSAGTQLGPPHKHGRRRLDRVNPLHQSSQGAAHSCWKPPWQEVSSRWHRRGDTGGPGSRTPMDGTPHYPLLWVLGALQLLCLLALKSLYLLCLMRLGYLSATHCENQANYFHFIDSETTWQRSSKLTESLSGQARAF